jgi:hypothetical protein
MAQKYAICFVSRQRELDLICEVLAQGSAEDFSGLVVGEVIPAGVVDVRRPLARPKALADGLDFQSFQVPSPTVGRIIDPLSARDVAKTVQKVAKNLGIPHLVVVTAQYGWRGLFWDELSTVFGVRTLFIPEGIGVLGADFFLRLSFLQSFRRYLGRLVDAVGTLAVANRSSLAPVSAREVWSLTVRLCRLLVLGRRSAKSQPDLTCDLLLSSWGEFTSPPHVTAGERRDVRGRVTLKSGRRRLSREGCLLLVSPIVSPERCWPAILRAIGGLGARRLAIKGHPGYELGPLVDAVANSEYSDSHEVLPSEIPAEHFLEAFRWDFVVGVYSTALLFSRANFPDDSVWTACRLIVDTAEEPHRPEATRASDEFLDSVRSLMAGPTIAVL